jgi:hypothetical protein
MQSPLVRTLAGAALGLALLSVPASAFADSNHPRRDSGFRVTYSRGDHGSVYFRSRHDRGYRYRRGRYVFARYPDLVVRRAYAYYDWDRDRSAYRRVIRVLIENRGDAEADFSTSAIRFSSEYGRRCDDVRIATPYLRPGEAVWIAEVDREWQRDGRERGRFTVEADYRHRLREYDEGNNRFGPIEYVYGIE